jgi:hypothetical protein
MSTDKKVVFSAQDNVSQKASQMYNNILANARKYTDTLKEQTNYINQQLKALEKKAQLEAKTGGGILQEQEQLFRSARSKGEQDKYRSRIDETKRGISESGAVVEALRGLLAEAKKQSSITEKAEKEQTKKIRQAQDQYQAKKSLWSQEVRYDKKGVKSRVSAAEKEGYDGMDPQQAEKLMYQKTLLGNGGGEKEKGIFGQVFAGTLAAGIVQKIASAMGTIISAKSGEEGINSLLGSVPLIGGVLGSGSQKTFEEQYGIQTGMNKLRGMTGNMGMKIGGNNELGYSTRENVEAAGGFISAAGNKGGYEKYGSQARTLERGLGLDTQTITQIVKDVRTSRSTADITQIASDIIRANPELRKDQTKFAEILNQTSQLTNQLASQTENVNQTQNAGVVGALRSIGGSFSDPVLGGKNMMSINQALTSPGNDFQKARSLSVLSSIKPGASYFQTLEAQEKGLGQKGYLEGTLKQLEKETGGGENLMLAVQQNLGLNYSTARKVVEARAKNPSMFTDFAGGPDDIVKKLGLTDKAKELTSSRDKQSAEISDAYAISAAAGDMKIAALTFKAGAEMIKDYATKVTSALGLGKIEGSNWKLAGANINTDQSLLSNLINSANGVTNH